MAQKKNANITRHQCSVFSGFHGSRCDNTMTWNSVESCSHFFCDGCAIGSVVTVVKSLDSFLVYSSWGLKYVGHGVHQQKNQRKINVTVPQCLIGRQSLAGAETWQQWELSSNYGDEIWSYIDLADYRFNQKAIFAYQFAPSASVSRTTIHFIHTSAFVY